MKKINLQGIRPCAVLLVCFILSFSVQAQQEQQPKNDVMYDPLFWKDQLKLRDDQCRSIMGINVEYYENLKKIFDGPSEDKNAIRKQAEYYLNERSQKIWDTFHTNQKRKWKKLWDHHYTARTKGKHDGTVSSSIAIPFYGYTLPCKTMTPLGAS